MQEGFGRDRLKKRIDVKKWKNISSANQAVINIIGTLLFRIMADLAYYYFVVPVWEYDGYIVNIKASSYLLSFLLVLVISPFLYMITQHAKPSDMMILIMSYLYFIPLATLFGFGVVPVKFFVVVTAYWLALIGYQFLMPTITLVKIKSIKCEKIIWIAVAICLCAVVVFVNIKYAGGRIKLDLKDEYTVRSEYSGYSIPFGLKYLVEMSPICLLICLFYWLKRKKWLVVSAIVFVYILLYSITAYKGVYFMLFMAATVYLLFKKWMISYFGIELTAFYALICILTKALDTPMLVSLFIRRTSFLVGKLSYEYYSFFNVYPLNLMRDGIMGKFGFDTNYNTTIQQVIGQFHGGGSWNNGLIGDMVANFPMEIGIILMPGLIVMCLRLMDAVAENVDKKLLVIVSIWHAIGFISGSWSTQLLTGGYLLTCILLYFYINGDENEKN